MAAKSPEEAKAQAEKKQRKTNKDRADLEQDFGGKTPKYFVSFDTYGNTRILQEIVGNQPEQRFVIVDSNGTDYDATLNGDQVVQQVRRYFKNNKEGLRKVLFNLGYMSEREYTTRSEQAITSAILKVANEYTIDVVDSYRIDGKVKFPTFTTWLQSIPSAKEEDGPRRPTRDINLEDRDVIKALVEDVYMSQNMQLPDDPNVIEQKVDRYMKMIKEGRLTTYKEPNKAGEDQAISTPGFSEARLRAELTSEIPKELPQDYQKAQSLNFLTFLDQMERR